MVEIRTARLKAEPHSHPTSAFVMTTPTGNAEQVSEGHGQPMLAKGLERSSVERSDGERSGGVLWRRALAQERFAADRLAAVLPSAMSLLGPRRTLASSTSTSRFEPSSPGPLHRV